MRIIGLNQDEKASGGMAGLTFQILPYIGDGTTAMDSNAIERDTFWYSNNIAKALASKSLYDKFATPNFDTSIITPVKKSCVSQTPSSATYRDIEAKLFCLSVTEITSSGRSDNGLGPNHNEQYLFYKGAVSGDARLKSMLIGGDGGSVWLRSARDYVNENAFYSLNSSGEIAWAFAGNRTYHCAVAFCM